jgi:hypothetical protein
MEHFNREDIERMRSRVQAMRGFYTHLLLYLLINLTLLIVNTVRNPETWWFHYTALGWGEWEESKIRDLLEKEKRKQNPS